MNDNKDSDGGYCVYLTTYLGDKLPSKVPSSNIKPTLYLGSGKVSLIEKTYRGSVSSRKYEKIWKQELKENFHLFEIKILKRFSNKKEALKEELQLHKKYDVVQNPIFVNMALATVNGCFGATGEAAWNFGKNKYNDEVVAAQVAKRTGKSKLSKDHLKKLVELRSSGMLYPEIGVILNSEGANILWTSLYKIFNLHKSKYEITEVIKPTRVKYFLPEELEKELIYRRDSGELFRELKLWLLNLGFNTGGAIDSVYERAKAKHGNQLAPNSSIKITRGNKLDKCECLVLLTLSEQLTVKEIEEHFKQKNIIISNQCIRYIIKRKELYYN